MIKPGISAYVIVELKNKDGKVVKRLKFKSKSWVQNMALLLNGAFSSISFNLIDQLGNNVNVSPSTDVRAIFRVNAGSGNDTYGILIGTGTNAVSPSDYKLGSKIPNSTLPYSGTTVESLSGSSSGYSFTITRTFNNTGSDAITVSEIGLAISVVNTGILIARDLLSSPITVQPNQVLTVSYTISITP